MSCRVMVGVFWSCGSRLVARSIGPALVSGELHDLWIYVVAPIVGAAIGAVAYQLVRGEHPT